MMNKSKKFEKENKFVIKIDNNIKKDISLNERILILLLFLWKIQRMTLFLTF